MNIGDRVTYLGTGTFQESPSPGVYVLCSTDEYLMAGRVLIRDDEGYTWPVGTETLREYNDN